MNDFDRYAHSEPSYQEYLERDEAEARRWDRRELWLRYEATNVVEAPEFRKAIRRGQMELDFNQEVA